MSTPATVVFLGPSLPVPTARERFDAEYRRPAQRGDIYECLGVGIERIVLIDGLFHGTPSVWQREILAALDEGIEVLGSSSMGALRAFELHAYGMVGIGTIFGWYRDGIIDGDDEVALLHGDAKSSYRPLSEPMVNIRATLARAVAQGALSDVEGARLIDEAKRTHYPGRSLRRLCEGATSRSWSLSRRVEIQSRLEELRVDLKRADAESLLEHCASRQPARSPLVVPSRDLHSTERAQCRLIAPGVSGEALLRLAEERGVTASLEPSLWRRWYAVQWAHDRGLQCPEGATREFRARFESEHCRDLEAWLCERRVTRGEYQSWIEERALLDWIAGHPDLVPGPRAERIDRVAREWLGQWGIDAGGIPDPHEFGFARPAEAALLVELLLSGEAGRLLRDVNV